MTIFPISSPSFFSFRSSHIKMGVDDVGTVPVTGHDKKTRAPASSNALNPIPVPSPPSSFPVAAPGTPPLFVGPSPLSPTLPSPSPHFLSPQLFPPLPTPEGNKRGVSSRSSSSTGCRLQQQEQMEQRQGQQPPSWPWRQQQLGSNPNCSRSGLLPSGCRGHRIHRRHRLLSEHR
jgi:hypothetical protein